ncbi:MAG TPA: putative Fe-S cluster assembly protein SufT [Armatimonadota bacterium]|nr:putative Fe-S cluster assembly protein SufT [Armatimonadota bacterium]
MLTQLSDAIRLKRDCPGIMIPAGTPVTLPAGSFVTLKQALGGDYTVRTDCGDIVRIAGADADAIGKEAPSIEAPAPGGPFNEKAIWNELRKVYDPEIPINIVELGLVYGCRVAPGTDGRRRVEITMTLTAPGCGMGEVLKQDVERKVGSLPGVDEVAVDLVFDPPWNQSRMSEAARLELGLF